MRVSDELALPRGAPLTPTGRSMRREHVNNAPRRETGYDGPERRYPSRRPLACERLRANASPTSESWLFGYWLRGGTTGARLPGHHVRARTRKLVGRWSEYPPTYGSTRLIVSTRSI